MFKRLFSFVLILTTPLVAADLPIDPAIRLGQLDNGITYYLRHYKEPHAAQVDDVGASTNRASLRLVVPIGSVQEEEGEEGLAHWCEHLCFRGTASFSHADIMGFLHEIGASMGPDANAYTSFDETVYMLDVPVDDPQHLVTAVSLMSEWASCATLDEAAIEAERLIVLEERRLSLGPQVRVGEGAISELLEGSKYAERLPIGLLETLNGATPETVRNFYQKWYPSVPVAFVAVGDFDVDAMEVLVEKLFGQLEVRMPREAIPNYAVPDHEGTRFRLITDPEITDAHVEILFKDEPHEGIREEVIPMLALGLFNDRFRGQAIAYELPPFVKGLSGTSIMTRCDAEDVFHELAKLTLDIRQVQEGGFTDGEFDRACRQLMSFLKLFERSTSFLTTQGIADDCVDHYLHGGELCSPVMYAEIIRQELAGLCVEKVNAVLAGLDLENNNIVVVTLPEQTEEADIAEVLMRVAYATALVTDPAPYVAEAMPEHLMLGPPIAAPALHQSGDPQTERTTLQFDNGLTLHLIPTQHNEETLVIDGVALGGLSDFDALQLPTARLVELLLDEAGIGPFSDEELSHLLSDKLVTLSRAYDTYTRSYCGACVSKDAETLFQLLHLAFTKQQTTSKQFEKVRERAIAAVQENESDPDRAFRREIRVINHSDHPYYRSSTVDDLEQANYRLADAIARTDFSNPAEFTFAIVGDFDVETIRELAATYLGSIPARPQPRDSYLPLDDQFPSGTNSYKIYRGREDKSIVQLTFPVSLNSPEAAEIDLVKAATTIVGGRVHNLMRGALNATYNVHAHTRFIEPDISKGWLTVRFGCDPRDADLLAQLAVRELRILAARGPTADEVTHLVRNHRRSTAEDLCNNNFLAGELLRHTLHHWDLEEMRHIPERVRLITKQNVAQQIREMLPLDNYTCVILLPENVAENSPNG